MTKPIRRVTIVGCGAVGLFYGAKLVRGELDVTFLARSTEAALRQNGIHVRSIDGDFHTPVKVVGDPERAEKPDLVLVCLKTTAREYLAAVLPRLAGPDTLVMTLMNGLGNETFLATLVPEKQVIAAVAFVCLNRTRPFAVEHTGFGHIKANSLTAGGNPQGLDAVTQVFKDSGIPFTVEHSLPKIQWEKLIWNIPFNGLSAALGGVDTEQLLKEKPTHELVRKLMTEVVTGAASQGISLDEALIEDNIQKTLTMGPYKTSMCLDRLQGKPVEVESILAEPLERAAAKGTLLPAMDVLCRMLRFYNARCVTAGAANIRTRLKNLLVEQALRFGDFTLASGQKSRYYINCKPVTLGAEGSFLVGQALLELLPPDCGAVGGLTLGADPIVSSITVAAWSQGLSIQGFLVRKEGKTHGTASLIENCPAKGTPCVIVEDVVTTGGSALKAAAAAQAAGLQVALVLALVDRNQGGVEAFAQRGIPVRALFTIAELLAAAEPAAGNPPISNRQSERNA